MRLTDDTFSRAARALDRLDRSVEGDDPDAGAGEAGRVSDARTAIDAALDTPRALAVLFGLVRKQNRDRNRGQNARALVRDLLATFALDTDGGLGVLDRRDRDIRCHRIRDAPVRVPSRHPRLDRDRADGTPRA